MILRELGESEELYLISSIVKVEFSPLLHLPLLGGDELRSTLTM
jgi:hypothetical protein